MNNRDSSRQTRGLLGLASCSRGGIAIIGLLSATAMIAMVGFGVDLTRLMLVKSRLQTAVDAAALAAGRGINPTSGTVDATAQADAKALFWSNFGRAGTNPDPTQKGYTGYLGATATGDPAITSPTNDTVLVQASATVQTTFMRVVGPSGSSVSAQASAKRAGFGMELALVLDITGSMGRTFQGDGVTRDTSTNINAMRQAATNLVDIVFGASDTQPNLFVSVVPFTATVNIGSNNTSWLQSGVDQLKYGGVNWKGCVEARANGEDQTDSTPSAKPFVPFLYKSTLGVYTNAKVPVKGDNDWSVGVITEAQQATLPDNTAVGPNLACPATAIQPLTANKSVVTTAINALVSTYRGGTTGNLGLQAGWWTLSPNWSGLWSGTPTTGLPNGATKLPLPYATPFMQKVVVFMTDGNNAWYDWPNGAPGNDATQNDVMYDKPARVADADYTAYGRLSENRLGLSTISIGNAKTELDTRTAAMCDKMKKAGIVIHTIILASSTSIDAATQALWQNCASTPANYHLSPTQADLATSFQQIGSQLANLRLTQ
jgi:Flp pilus assembly protein TadG